MEIPVIFTSGTYAEAQSMKIERFSIKDAEFFEPKVMGLLEKAQMILTLTKELEEDGYALGLLTAIERAVREFWMCFPVPEDFPREDCFMSMEKGMHRCHGLLNMAAELVELVELSNQHAKRCFENFRADFDLMERTIAMMLGIYCLERRCA